MVTQFKDILGHFYILDPRVIISSAGTSSHGFPSITPLFHPVSRICGIFFTPESRGRTLEEEREARVGDGIGTLSPKRYPLPMCGG